jgi:hypothetical protein
MKITFDIDTKNQKVDLHFTGLTYDEFQHFRIWLMGQKPILNDIYEEARNELNGDKFLMKFIKSSKEDKI